MQTSAKGKTNMKLMAENAVRILNKRIRGKQQTQFSKGFAVPGDVSQTGPDARLIGPL